MTKQTKHEIPKPPNDGRTYKYVAGKHVAVGEKQQPVVPASMRRATAEAEAETDGPEGLQGSARELVANAAALDAETASAWLETERANAGRKTVVEALEARIEELDQAAESGERG